jgi:hypothetical protein
MVFEFGGRKPAVKIEMSSAINGRQLWVLKRLEQKAEGGQQKLRLGQ